MTLAARTVLDVVRLLNEGLQYDDPERQLQSVELAQQTLLDAVQPTDDAYERIVEAADKVETEMEEAATEEERLEALVSFRDTVEALDNEIQEQR